MTKNIRNILGVLFAIVVLASCDTAGADGGSGSGSGAAGGLGAGCDPTDVVVIGGTTFTEAASSAYPPNCDPQILANHFDDLVGSGPVINLLVSTGFNGSSFSELELNMNIYGDTPGTYAYGGAGTPTSGTFGATLNTVVATPPTGCVVQAGTVTVTKVESAGGKVEGTFSFTSVGSAPGGPACGPAPVNGSFSATRNDL